MKRTSTILFPLVAGLVSFGVGYAVRPSVTGSTPPSNRSSGGPAETWKGINGAAWQLALAERHPVRRLDSLTDLLAIAPASGLAQLAEEQVDDPDALGLILRQWAQSDPLAAAGWVLKKVRDGRVVLAALGPVVEVWAERDPTSLTAWFREPGHGMARNMHLVKLTGVLFDRDPAAALALAHDFPSQWKLPENAMDWIKVDPEAAIKMLNSLPFGRNNANAAVGEALPVWAEKDPRAAAEWSALQGKENKGAGRYFLGECLETWASRDPAAAAAYFTGLPQGSASAAGLVKVWAGKDAESALRWAEQADVSKKGELISAAIQAVADADVHKAAELVSGMADGSLRDKASAGLTRAWAMKDPLAALTWASGLPNGSARNNSIADAASTWAGKDVKAAADWVKEAPEGSLPPTVYSRIMWRLDRDIPAAFQWLNELPEEAADHVLNTMSGLPREPEATAALALPEGKYKARMVEKVSSSFFSRSPDQALAWALALPETGQREKMRQVVEAMEPVEQFSSWNGITGEKKAEILKRLK